MNKLLIDDYPIQVLPRLAVEIGLNEAIFVQQLHYWLNGKSSKWKDGRKWIYNTYEDWQKQFPFWSISTIRRTISSCVQQGVVLKGNYNKAGFDNTPWYSIDYDKVESMNRPSVQNEQTISSKWTDPSVQNGQTNTIDYTETTSETTKDTMSGKPDAVPCKEVIEYLNKKAGKNFKVVDATKRLVKAREKEGFTLVDFQQVIDNKVADWLGNKKMEQYIRPQTLFGTKFEAYLNEKPDGPDPDGGDEYAGLGF